MKPTKREDLSEIVHEVYSKGGSLQDAADLLEKASEAERRTILRLMSEQARGLADFIADFEKKEDPGL